MIYWFKFSCIVTIVFVFEQDQFYDYMFQEAVKTDNKLLLDNKPKFVLTHASSGFKHSLRGNNKSWTSQRICSQSRCSGIYHPDWSSFAEYKTERQEGSVLGWIFQDSILGINWPDSINLEWILEGSMFLKQIFGSSVVFKIFVLLDI